MAAILKFAAISVIAAALLAAACSDSGGSPEPTPSPSTTPPPPTATQRVVTTPTPVPTGVVSPASTPGWLTYTSPFGFSLDFPEEWLLKHDTIGCCVPGGTQLSATFRLMNTVHFEALEPREYVPPPDAVQIKVTVHPSREDGRHEPEYIIRECETAEEQQDSLGIAERIVVAGLPAISCTVADVFSTGTWTFQNQWIELASGRMLVISTSLMEPSSLEQSRVGTVLASLTFEDAHIDTSAWPTFSSPLGFDIKYPPDWTVVESELSDFQNERVRIYNELTYENYLERLGTPGRGYAPEAGAAWFDIHAIPFGSSDQGGLPNGCGSDQSRAEGRARAENEVVDGRAAIRCIQSEPGEVDFDSEVIWVEHPPGRAIHVGWTVNGDDADLIALGNAALATITFHE